MEPKHNGEMGRAGGEGFGPACGWAQLSDGRNDFDIRAQYYEERNRGKQHSNRIDRHFIKRSVPTGQGQRGMSQKKRSIRCEAQKGSEDTWHVCAVGTGIPPPRPQRPTAGPSSDSWAVGGAEAARGGTGHRPHPQEERPGAPGARKRRLWWRSSAKKRFCLGSKGSLES